MFCFKIPSLPVAAETFPLFFKVSDLCFNTFTEDNMFHVLKSFLFLHIGSVFPFASPAFQSDLSFYTGPKSLSLFPYGTQRTHSKEGIHTACRRRNERTPSPGLMCILSVQSPGVYRWMKLAQNDLKKLTVLISKSVQTGIPCSLLNSALDWERYYPEMYQNNQELLEHKWQKNPRTAVTTKAKDVLVILCL